MIKIYSLDFKIIFKFRKILHHIFVICSFVSRHFYGDCALYYCQQSFMALAGNFVVLLHLFMTVPTPHSSYKLLVTVYCIFVPRIIVASLRLY